MVKNCEEILNQKYNELQKETDAYTRVESMITFIESFIPEFFSKDGEEKGIRSMYKDLHVAMESVFYDKKVPCVDIHHGFHIFKEYLEGMNAFISDVKEADGALEMESFEEKICSAREKDGLFIESLYGGSLNKVVDTELSEATSNIEFLIDFIPELKRMKETCKEYHESAIEEGDKGRLIKESMDMLYDSISHYCYHTIENVITTYESIQRSLSGEDVTMESVETKKVAFKLF